MVSEITDLTIELYGLKLFWSNRVQLMFPAELLRYILHYTNVYNQFINSI